ncbi:hypothetical protein [Alicyclobacillus sp. ALC3]|uniref:hypothetical protein n=1 Tax=Alicyclobacillus sp. ALC3 TaxID=2796143 RepID=UPI0023780B4A|nr:hypothetical protein [Alicyclobacillus sp. ALC3]WDL98095.1 hypothetical protein JC200_05180 [Alicyclobacillus sp. ALC3]
MDGGISIFNPDKKAERWKEAKVRCKLSNEAVKMAKEMGLNPLSLIKNIPNQQQLWKSPVEEWVRDMYEQRKTKSKKFKESSRKTDIPKTHPQDKVDAEVGVKMAKM